MNDRISLVTGSYSGIGEALCQQLLERGDALVLVNRDGKRTRAQIENLASQYPGARIAHDLADFADQSSIRAMAGRIAGKYRALDAVYVLAGVLKESEQWSADGLELHFAVNCVAPVLLAKLLRPQLAAANGGRVVGAGSVARNMVRRLDVTDLVKPGGGAGMAGYARSKQAFAAAFSAFGADYARDGIDLRVVDIAPTRTPMAHSRALPLVFRMGRFLFVSPERSAARLIQAGTAGNRSRMRNLPDAASQAALVALLDTVTAGRVPAP